MSKNVLFTCVGTTDPIRDNFDGSMLHIIRHYRPYWVYIFFSREMGERELRDLRYSRSIELLSKHMGMDIGVEKIFSQIDNAHDFDAYMEPFAECMDRIKKNHPEDTILLNVSSGTPQMKAMMCLETVVSGRRLVPVQVSSPSGRSNQSRVNGEDYDVELEFANNLDNEPDAENRCSEPDILSFRRTLAKGQLISLIKVYDYKAAKLLSEKFYPSIDKKVLLLLDHLIHRMNLKDSLAKEAVKDIKDMDFYPVKDIECQKVCEYLNILRIYQQTGDLSGFVLRLNPLIVKLQSGFLRKGFGFEIDKITEKTPKGEIKVRYQKLKALDDAMAEYINMNFYKGELWELSYLNIRIQNAIIEYKLLNQSDKLLLSFQEFFKAMERLNEDYRNLLAHDLYGVGEPEIFKLLGMPVSRVVRELERLVKYIYGNHCRDEIFDIYERINGLIVQELEKPDNQHV